jgi:3-deoxy-manno-octulosonate cytidylyltransferase (CMP-KDO synthetase)
LIRRVARRVASFELGMPVVVATDDPRVAAAVSEVPGVTAVLTPPGLRSGTERVAEVLQMPRYAATDVVLNVQGDQPLIPRAALAGALQRVLAGQPIGTAAARLETEAVADPNCVKVAVDRRGYARGFYRQMPPEDLQDARWSWWQHLGVYAYETSALRRWVALPPVPEEAEFQLEQLRPLAHGMDIGVAVLDERAPPAVDTEEDVQRVERHLALAT